MIQEIVSFLIGKFIEIVPPLLGRHLYPASKAAKNIKLGLREEKPIGVSLTIEVPRLDIYFDITNLTPMNLFLDKLFIEVWFGQPTFDGVFLHPQPIPANRITSDIHYNYFLNDYQVKQIQQFQTRQGSFGRLLIYLTAYFQSRVGIIEVKRNIEREGV